jgi:hypothetical protein
MLRPGQPAPNVKLTTHEGKEVSLKDFRGKKVLLWFYPKADTPGCTLEGKGLRDRAQEFAQKNLGSSGRASTPRRTMRRSLRSSASHSRSSATPTARSVLRAAPATIPRPATPSGSRT